jgi:hypothetical protein
MTLPQARQNLLFLAGGQLAFRWPAAQSVNQGTIPPFAQAEQHPPHLAVANFQSLGSSYLRQMLLLYLVQHFQAVPFSLVQGDSLRFHSAATYESGHFYFAQAGHSHFAPIDSKRGLTRHRNSVIRRSVW